MGNVIAYNEEMVGSGHPTKTDTLNRGFLTEHNSTGTHKALTTVGTFTRDLSAASGNQAVTGVGFTPRAVVFFSNLPATTNGSISQGIDDGTTREVIYTCATDGYQNSTSYSIICLVDGGTNYQSGYVTSLDADGFTVAWTKSNTPTGTARIDFIAFR